MSGAYPTPDTRHPTPRSGISLTEVLIAMGIMTVGLLGVASVFPVGSWYMQKAMIADQGSAIAQSVMNDIVARGMLNPNAWNVMVPNPRSAAPAVWNSGFSSDGKYSPLGTPRAGAFARPFALALGEALSQSAASTDRTLIAKQFGSAYVIDPLGISALGFRKGAVPPATWANAPAGLFPATAYNAFWYYAQNGGWSSPSSVAWSPWSGGKSSTYNGYEWPIRRVTFRQADTGWQMDPTMAEHYFRGSDDLAYDFPARDDRPAMQNWDSTNVNGKQTPLARKWTGDYSWIVTVAPTTNAARDGMARNPEGFAYDVSVVVFYKRVLPESADSVYPVLGGKIQLYLSAMGKNERAVRAVVQSTGTSGGELLLTDFGDVVDESNKAVSAFDHLKTGQWVMLCGPHPNSTTSEPRFALKWYQVLSIDAAGTGIANFDQNKNRVIAVRGPQWPWVPGGTASDDLCVGICRGAVAVHTKTLRLESSQGSTSQAFGSTGNPTLDPPRYFP